MERAARALRSRDLSAAELDARLDRANVAPAARAETIARLSDAGAVDDERFARSRAQALAGRGAGDFAGPPRPRDARHRRGGGRSGDRVPRAGARPGGPALRQARGRAEDGPLSGAQRLLGRRDRDRVLGSRCRARPSGCTMRRQQHEVLPAHAQFPNSPTSKDHEQSTLIPRKDAAERGSAGTG